LGTKCYGQTKKNNQKAEKTSQAISQTLALEPKHHKIQAQ
jgi:hypothetical protein